MAGHPVKPGALLNMAVSVAMVDKAACCVGVASAICSGNKGAGVVAAGIVTLPVPTQEPEMVNVLWRFVATKDLYADCKGNANVDATGAVGPAGAGLLPPPQPNSQSEANKARASLARYRFFINLCPFYLVVNLNIEYSHTQI